jgi:hypothetical protein
MLYSTQMAEHFELKTPDGSVFWCAVPLRDHRKAILSELSRATGVEISESDMETSRDGRPEFTRLGFDANWTHSKGVCVLAYSFSLRVGVDIEKIRPRTMRIAERFFSKEEKDFLFETWRSKDSRLAEFYRLWCRKEAFFKCAGGSFFKDSLPENMLRAQIGKTALYDFELPFTDPFAGAIAVQSRLKSCR